jgi:hypothetical protein
MSCLCPQKKKKPSDDGKAKTHAVTRVIEEEEEEEHKKGEKLTRDQLKKGLKGLTDENKDALIEELIADSPDSVTSDF